MKSVDLLNAVQRSIGKQPMKSLVAKPELHTYLGMSKTATVNWSKQKSDLTPLQVANAIKKARTAATKEAHSGMLNAIVEMFPIDAQESSRGAKDELFVPDAADKYRLGLRTELKTKSGIYIFYDSRGRALYAGKAKTQSLWAEMANAFNRNRERSQTVFRVKHPERAQPFKPASEHNRQPKRIHQYLHELAHFFSAYEVSEPAINTLEALLVRGFANDLLNARMESLKDKPKKATTQTKKVRKKSASTQPKRRS